MPSNPVSDSRDLEKGSDPMTLGQGDLRLLESEVAQRLLSSRIPARFAYLPPTERHACWQRGSTGRVRPSRCRPSWRHPQSRLPSALGGIG